MKNYLHSWLFGRPPFLLRYYDARRLGFVRNWLEPLADCTGSHRCRPIAELCDELEDASGPQPVAAKVGAEVIDDYPYFTWDDWATLAASTGNHGLAVYCLANAWLQLDFRSTLPGLDGWQLAWSNWEGEAFRPDMEVTAPYALAEAESERLCLITTSLQALNLSGVALQAFNCWLGIEDQELYSNAERLHAHCKSSPLSQVRQPRLRVMVLRRLSSILAAVNRNVNLALLAPTLGLTKSGAVG